MCCSVASWCLSAASWAALAGKSSWCCIVEQIQSPGPGAEPGEVAGADAGAGEWQCGEGGRDMT